MRTENSDNCKEQIKNKLFVLAGPSAVGKSTVLSKMVEEGLCKLVIKYSDREDRKSIFDDIQSVSKEQIRKFCTEVLYEMYGNLYGFDIDTIKEDLYKNHLITICSDFVSIKKMKNIFNKNFTAIFIYLQNISVENLLKAFSERKKISFSNELFELAKKLSEILKIENNAGYNDLEKSFKSMMKECLPISDYEEFIKRYECLINFNKKYTKNKDLFEHTISGRSTDELVVKCREIIKNQEGV